MLRNLEIYPEILQRGLGKELLNFYAEVVCLQKYEFSHCNQRDQKCFEKKLTNYFIILSLT
jgi:hypothetical protein